MSVHTYMYKRYPKRLIYCITQFCDANANIAYVNNIRNSSYTYILYIHNWLTFPLHTLDNIFHICDWKYGIILLSSIQIVQ